MTSLICWRSAAARAGFADVLAKALDGKHAAISLTPINRATGSG